MQQARGWWWVSWGITVISDITWMHPGPTAQASVAKIWVLGIGSITQGDYTEANWLGCLAQAACFYCLLYLWWEDTTAPSPRRDPESWDRAHPAELGFQNPSHKDLAPLGARLITESHRSKTHRIVKVGRDLWKCSSTPCCSKQGQLETGTTSSWVLSISKDGDA